jgi:hypothetical protein
MIERDPAPTPWRVQGAAIRDNDGKFIAAVADRVVAAPGVMLMLRAAPDMCAALLAIDAAMDDLADDIRCRADAHALAVIDGVRRRARLALATVPVP